MKFGNIILTLLTIMILTSCSGDSFNIMLLNNQGIAAPKDLDHFDIALSSFEAMSGKVYRTRVVAKDSSNNTLTNYSGTVSFSSSDSDGAVILPVNYTFTAEDSGMHYFTGVTFITSGSQSITVTDSVKAKEGVTNILVLGSLDTSFKFLASDSGEYDYLGMSISTSSDGESVIIGAPNDNDGGADSGSVYIYKWSGADWTETKIIASDDNTNDRFGSAVSISGDGGIVVVSALNDDDGADDSGSIYIYEWNGTNWIETKIVASDGDEDDSFGTSASISKDGNTILVGSYGDDDSGSYSGSVYIYKRNGTNWIETKIIASDGVAYDYFGGSSSISSDGETFIVGAYGNGSGGSAYIYKWNGTNWLETKMVASDESLGDSFGSAVSISNDGETVLIGAYSDDDNGLNSGSAYVYKWDNSNWVEAKISASDGAASDKFGHKVSISGDGLSIIVSSTYDNNVGSAYIYRSNGVDWIEQKIIASDAYTGDNFGAAVSISDDGSSAVVGASFNDDGESGAGSAYFFPLLNQATNLTISGSMANRAIFCKEYSVSMDTASINNHALSIAGYEQIINLAQSDSGTFYSDPDCLNEINSVVIPAADVRIEFYFKGNNYNNLTITASDELGALGDGTLNLIGTPNSLVASDGVGGEKFGTSISTSSDGETIIIGAPYAGIGGAVYIRKWDGSSWIESKIIAGDIAADDQFGKSITISNDGLVAIVGAPGDDDKGANSGSAYVYRWNGTSWDETKIVTGDGDAGDRFGSSTSMSGDGDALLVGAEGDDWDAGSAYVYKWNGTSWIESKITASDGNFMHGFGISVSISDSGEIAVVGASRNSGEAPLGSAYIYRWDGSNWVETKLLASDGVAGDMFGGSVAISGDGNTILIGSMSDSNGYQSGVVYAYNWDGASWIEGKIVSSDIAAYDMFGSSISISTNGESFVVGAYGDSDGGADSGSVYIYKRNISGPGWLETKVTETVPSAKNYFGISTSISADGGTVVVGSSFNDYMGIDSGAIEIFQVPF